MFFLNIIKSRYFFEETGEFNSYLKFRWLPDPKIVTLVIFLVKITDVFSELTV